MDENAGRFLCYFDNTENREVFRYEFKDRGETIERGSAPHPRIVGQRFEAFKIHRRAISDGSAEQR